MDYRRFGFTLVEACIVIVIIGLITGSLLVSRHLLMTATLRAASQQVHHAQTAVTMFRDRYHALPGDIANASVLWPTDAAVDGNANGRLDGTDDVESFNAWHHLSLSGLYPNSSRPVSSPPAPANWESARGAIDGTFLHLTYGATFTVTAQANYLTLTKSREPLTADDYLALWLTTLGIKHSGLVPFDAQFIDTKIDDGTPLSGKIISVTGASDDLLDCTDPSGENAYNLRCTWGSCGLWMSIPYGG